MAETYGFIRYNHNNRKLCAGPCTTTAEFADQFYPISNFNAKEMEYVKKLNNAEVKSPYYMYVSYDVKNNRAIVKEIVALIFINDIGNGHLYAHGERICRDSQGNNIIDIYTRPNTVTGDEKIKNAINEHALKKKPKTTPREFPFGLKIKDYPSHDTKEGIVTEIKIPLNYKVLDPYTSNGYKIGIVLGGNIVGEEEIVICNGFETVSFDPYKNKANICSFYENDDELKSKFKTSGFFFFVAYKESEDKKTIEGFEAVRASELIPVCEYKDGEEDPARYKKEKVKNITITDTEIICNEIETANAIVNKLITEKKDYRAAREALKKWSNSLTDQKKNEFKKQMLITEYNESAKKTEEIRKALIQCTNECIDGEEDNKAKLNLYVNSKCAYIFKQPYSDFYKTDNLEEAKQTLIKCIELYEEVMEKDPNLVTGYERMKSNIDTKWRQLMRLMPEDGTSYNVQSIEEYMSTSITERERIKIHHMEKPVVTLEKGQIYSFDDRIICTFVIHNIGGKDRQDAKDVYVNVFPFASTETNDKRLYVGDIKAGHSSTVHVQFENSAETTKKLSFSVNAEYNYYFIDTNNDDNKSQDELKKVHAQANLEKSILDEDGRLIIDINFTRKHEVAKTNLNKFDANGSIDFSDEGLKEILKNRKEAIDETLSKITDGAALSENPKWVMFQGEWRVGKTVILKCLENRISSEFENAIIVDVNMQNAAASDDFKVTFAEELYTEIEKVSETLGLSEEFDSARKKVGIEYSLLDSNITWKSISLFMSWFSKAVNEKGKRIILVVDEFTSLYRAILKDYESNHEFPIQFLSFIESNKLICITAGGEHSNAIMVKYAANIFQKIGDVRNVEYLSESDVRKYIYYVLGESDLDTPITQDDSRFDGEVSESAISRVYELTKGNAFLLMKLFTRIVDLINAKNSSSIFSEKMISSAIEKMCSGNMMKNEEDLTTVEAELFNSLYNPMNEDAEDSFKITDRIEDDEVKKDNILILHTLVKYADKKSHECDVDVLKNECIKAGMSEDIFEHRYQMLKVRKIIVENASKDKTSARMRVDLYYEIMHDYV